MFTEIKKFKDFISENNGPKIYEAKDYTEVPKVPLIYKGYYLIVWPWRNEERHPDKSWGFTISDNPEGENYMYKTKGPAGNYEKASNEAQTIIDNIVQKSGQ
jgi:hypothetical protein